MTKQKKPRIKHPVQKLLVSLPVEVAKALRFYCITHNKTNSSVINEAICKFLGLKHKDHMLWHQQRRKPLTKIEEEHYNKQDKLWETLVKKSTEGLY